MSKESHNYTLQNLVLFNPDGIWILILITICFNERIFNNSREDKPVKDKAQTALFKDPVRTTQ